MEQSICLCNANRPWGGGEKWTFEHALLLRDKGWTVHAVCHTESELADRLDEAGGVDVMRKPISSTSFLNPFLLLSLRDFFKKTGVRHVLCARPADLKACGLAARLAGVPDVVYRRGIGVPVRDSALNRLLYGKVMHKLIVNSRDTRDMVLKNNPGLIGDDRIHLVYCGFNVADFDAKPARSMFEREPGRILIGNAGRLTEQKGQIHLLEAAGLLKRRGLDFRVYIAGKGALEDQLKTKSRELGVDDVVEFVGFLEDMKSFYQSIDIFALPSLWEGFGHAQAEAMLCSRPVVAFDVSSIPEVVADGKTGLLAPVGDAQTLADHLQRLANDADLRESMGRAGRARVIEHFSHHKVLADLERVLAL